ncbi:MAG: hypothetical protein LCH43_11250 [Actinobacteria bacterium]|nr:hypothetical protein [Actinomycetota bacterium]
MTDASTGTYGILRVTTSVTPNAAGKYWDIAWAVYLIENGGPNLAYDLSGVGASVVVGTVGTVWSGTFTFDWRSGGNQSTLIASGTTRVYSNPDGTVPAGIYVQGNIDSTGTSSAGGPSSVSESPALSTLKVVPGTPSAVTATRISDTSDTVAWSHTSATNGQPVTNTIRQKVNGGAWADVVTIAAAASANLSCAANQKIIYGVKATNAAGDSAWSADSAPLFTTPAAPTGVTATKVGSDIVIGWTPNVAFTEHTHVVEHGYSTDGGATWSAWSTLTSSVLAGTSTYTHAAPNAAQLHRYRVSAKNTNVATLTSAAVVSNSVQLLTAPNKPTIPALAPFQDKAATFRFPWAHNPVDTTAQTKRQVRYSTDGGSTWTTGAKTASANQYLDFAGSTWAANVAVTFQVRTKGDYDSGSDGDASYSPWSDSVTVTFKTKPVVTIPTPANSSTFTQATLTVALGFSQAEAATFVSATIGLYAAGGSTLLEQVVSNTLGGTLLATRLADGTSYVVKATVTDSNGITSSQVTSSFSVDYTEPVAAVVAISYLSDSGIVQVDLTIPGAGGGLVAATSVTIDRVIDGVSENVVSNYPSASSLTILDTTPTIHGVNLYRVTTKSVDGATTVVSESLTVEEGQWAFLSTGAGFSTIVKFFANLHVSAAPSRNSTLFAAAGRRRPIALFGTNGDLVVSGTVDLAPECGSTPQEVEEFILTAGVVCYRDPSGRRMFGVLSGEVDSPSGLKSAFQFKVRESS